MGVLLKYFKILTLSWVVALFACSATAITVEELDAIVAKAPDLDSLLQDQSLMNEYLAGLQEYYGKDKFNLKSAQEIINQLNQLKEQVPALKSRLWETQGLGTPFSIRTVVKTSGRHLNSDLWRVQKSAWLSSLKVEIQNLGGEANVGEILRSADAKIENFEKSIASLSKKQQQIETQKFFSTIKKDPQVRAAIAKVVQSKVTSEEMKDLLSSGDADLVLDTLETLRSNPRATNWSVEYKVPNRLVSFVKDLIPAPSELMKDTQLFPFETYVSNRNKLIPTGKSGTVTYEFKPLPRRIHGVWKGIPLGECVGGNCESLDALTPERWATVALKDTEFHVIEVSGSYRGFVQAVPLEFKGRRYASVDFGAPVLRNRAVVEGASKDERIQTDLFSLWVSEANRHKPANWEGYVVGKSTAINNAGVIPHVHSSTEYLLNEPLGDFKLFHHIDPLAEKIVQAFPETKYTRLYSGNMILDGTVPNAGDLTLVKPAPFSRNDLYNTEKFKELLKKATPTAIDRVLDVMASGPMAGSPEVRKVLVPLFPEMPLKQQVKVANIFSKGQANFPADPQFQRAVIKLCATAPENELWGITRAIGQLAIDDAETLRVLAKSIVHLSSPQRDDLVKQLSTQPPSQIEALRALAEFLKPGNDPSTKRFGAELLRAAQEQHPESMTTIAHEPAVQRLLAEALLASDHQIYFAVAHIFNKNQPIKIQDPVAIESIQRALHHENPNLVEMLRVTFRGWNCVSDSIDLKLSH